MRKLSAKQQAFCRAYITNGGNATQAAIKAGYSEKGVRVTACRLLTNVNIKEKIGKQQAKVQEAFTITVEERLKILDKVTKAGLKTYKDQQDNKRPNSLPAVVSAVSEINKMLGPSTVEDEALPVQVIFNVRKPVKPE